MLTEQDQEILDFIYHHGMGSFMFVGTSESGKSYCLKYLMSLLKKKFDYGVLISGSAYESGQYDYFPPAFIHSEWNPFIIYRIIDKQKELVAVLGPHKAPQCCLIIDDLCGLIDRSKEQIGLLKKLYADGRHANIRIFSLVQDVFMLPPTIRKNSKYFLITSAHEKDLEEIYPSIQGFENKKSFIKFVQEETSKTPWQCLLLRSSGRIRNNGDNWISFEAPQHIRKFKLKFKHDDSSDEELSDDIVE